MRFFRWYWSLVKEFFSGKEEKGKGFWESFWARGANIIKLYLLTVAMALLATFLWSLLPVPAQKSIIGFVVDGWGYLVNFAKLIWVVLDPIKPYFIWLKDLDKILQNIVGFLFHLCIGVIVMAFMASIFLDLEKYYFRARFKAFQTRFFSTVYVLSAYATAIFAGYWVSSSRPVSVGIQLLTGFMALHRHS